MKKLITTFGIFLAIFLFTDSQLLAQGKVTEKKLIGTWKLVIDIDEEMEEAREEMDEEDNILGEMILSGVSGLVEGILNNIDIYFEFQKGGKVIVSAEAFGEQEDEPEISSWYINNRGELIIEDTDKISADDNDYWLMDGKYLVSYENGKMEENVYMRRIE